MQLPIPNQTVLKDINYRDRVIYSQPPKLLLAKAKSTKLTSNQDLYDFLQSNGGQTVAKTPKVKKTTKSRASDAYNRA
jgi:hypothetical protein